MKEELLLTLLKMKGELDKYVYIREDDKGVYIEYAFIDGSPNDNRCLSWYDKQDPEGLKIDRPIDKIYKLSQFTCGHENEPQSNPNHCSPGCPSKTCSYVGKNWSYEFPKKCACWSLKSIDINKLSFCLSIKSIEKLINDFK